MAGYSAPLARSAVMSGGWFMATYVVEYSFQRGLLRRYDFFARFLAPFFAAFFAPFLAPLAGTLAPFLRASDKPMAMACLRLFTVRPLPLLSFPRFFLCMAFSTFFPADFEYFAIKSLSLTHRKKSCAAWG